MSFLKSFVFGLAFLLILEIAPAFAEKRVAFVVGNAVYKISALNNPVNDADDVANAPTSLGFDVVARTDVTFENLKARSRISARRRAAPMSP